jgi:hypothetical protein
MNKSKTAALNRANAEEIAEKTTARRCEPNQMDQEAIFMLKVLVRRHRLVFLMSLWFLLIFCLSSRFSFFSSVICFCCSLINE